jgi:hypothetical protein
MADGRLSTDKGACIPRMEEREEPHVRRRHVGIFDG